LIDKIDVVPRRSREEAAETRRQIVDTAVAVASTDGLEGLTIGRLADEIGMSKSGLLGHFGTKEALQLAAFEEASEIFTREVWARAAGEAPGLPRLRAAVEAWVSYLERGVFPGGCFFAAASAELDDRPGVVRDRLAVSMRRWLDILAADAREAQRVGDLPPEPSPEQLAFEINGIVLGTNQGAQLFDDPETFARARTALARILGV
jgi:AcrR family transcriptional regulator